MMETQIGSLTPRMEAKLWVEIKTIQDKMDDGQEEMNVQVGSLVSQIDANQEEMKSMLDACLEKMEANPGEMKSVAEQQEEAAVKPVRALKKWHADWTLAVGCRQKLKKGPRAVVGPGRNWPPPTEG
jgi:hypothetical protein